MVRAVLTVFPAEMRFFLPSRAFCCYPLVYRIVERNAIKEFIFSVCLSFTIAVHSVINLCSSVLATTAGALPVGLYPEEEHTIV